MSNMHQIEGSTDLRFGFLSLQYVEGQGLAEHWKLNASSFKVPLLSIYKAKRTLDCATGLPSPGDPWSSRHNEYRISFLQN